MKQTFYPSTHYPLEIRLLSGQSLRFDGLASVPELNVDYSIEDVVPKVSSCLTYSDSGVETVELADLALTTSTTDPDLGEYDDLFEDDGTADPVDVITGITDDGQISLGKLSLSQLSAVQTSDLKIVLPPGDHVSELVNRLGDSISEIKFPLQSTGLDIRTSLSGLHKITSLYIPPYVTSLCPSALIGCTSLSALYVPAMIYYSNLSDILPDQIENDSRIRAYHQTDDWLDTMAEINQQDYDDARYPEDQLIELTTEAEKGDGSLDEYEDLFGNAYSPRMARNTMSLFGTGGTSDESEYDYQTLYTNEISTTVRTILESEKYAVKVDSSDSCKGEVGGTYQDVWKAQTQLKYKGKMSQPEMFFKTKKGSQYIQRSWKISWNVFEQSVQSKDGLRDMIGYDAEKKGTDVKYISSAKELSTTLEWFGLPFLKTYAINDGCMLDDQTAAATARLKRATFKPITGKVSIPVYGIWGNIDPQPGKANDEKLLAVCNDRDTIADALGRYPYTKTIDDNQLSGAIEAIQAKINQTNKELETAERELAALIEKYQKSGEFVPSDLQAEISQLETELVTLANNNLSVDKEIAKQTSKHAQIPGSVSERNAELKKQSRIISEQTTTINELNGNEALGIKGSIPAKEDELKDLKSKSHPSGSAAAIRQAQKIKKAEDDLEELKSECTKAENKLNAAKEALKKVNDAIGEYNSLTDTINDLNEALTKGRTQASEKRAQLNFKKEEAQRIKDQNGGNVNTYTARYNIYDVIIKNNQNYIDSLTNQLDKLKRAPTKFIPIRLAGIVKGDIVVKYKFIPKGSYPTSRVDGPVNVKPIMYTTGQYNVCIHDHMLEEKTILTHEYVDSNCDGRGQDEELVSTTTETEYREFSDNEREETVYLVASNNIDHRHQNGQLCEIHGQTKEYATINPFPVEKDGMPSRNVSTFPGEISKFVVNKSISQTLQKLAAALAKNNCARAIAMHHSNLQCSLSAN